LDRLLPGTMVEVLGRDGLTLLIAPVNHPTRKVNTQVKRLPQSLPVESAIVLRR
jgi:hypothetical protein